jgi:proteic killer suppression protein
VAAESQIITLDVTSARAQDALVIRSFGDRETEAIFKGQRSRRLPPEIQLGALRKLLLLDAAVVLADLRIPPGNRLEALTGTRTGRHSIRVNDQWRVCFRWEDGFADEVEIVDYHG